MKRTEIIARRGAAITACAAALLLTACWTTPALAAEGCGNEAQRVEQASTYLPDCRAYELIAPTGYESAEPKVVPTGSFERELDSPEGFYASISGERVAWASEYPSPQSTGLNYLSTRAKNGWTTEDVIPPQTVANGLLCPHLVQMAAYSTELTRGVLTDGIGQPGSGANEGWDCGHDDPLLVPGEPVGFQNLFLRDNENVSYRLVDVTPANAPTPTPGPVFQYFPAGFQAGSSDLSHVVFEEELPLAEGAGGGDELYEYFDGAVHLVTYLPGGTPVHGVLAGSTLNTQLRAVTEEFLPHNVANDRRAMSADGSRVFFEAEGGLYSRTNAEQSASEECSSPSKACSMQIDQAQAGAEGPSGGGKFMLASEDGSRVFFTDANRLVAGALAESGKPDLYEYDFDRSAGSRLVDLTAGSGGPGEVLGVSGASGNGEDVYFVAEAALTGGRQSSSGAVAQAGHPNLYLAREGALTFIASLDPSADSCDWNTACYGGGATGLTARTSGSGVYIAFDSDLGLTGYENEGPRCVPEGLAEVEGYTPGRCEEIYLYSESDNKLECVSCDPAGVPPVSPAVIRYPSTASLDNEMRNVQLQRNVSESGQVFFESKDPLVPAAANGRLNVYEYEHGEVHLISSGTSDADSYFLDASADGSDVFFATAQALVKRAEGAVYSVYDARIGGGFRVQSESVTPPACLSLEGCHSPLSEPPAEFSVASATLVGPGNLEAKKPDVNVEKPAKKTVKQNGKSNLASALKKCARLYQHDRRKRLNCMQRARKRLSRKATAGRQGHRRALHGSGK